MIVKLNFEEDNNALAARGVACVAVGVNENGRLSAVADANAEDKSISLCGQQGRVTFAYQQ